MGWDGMGCCLRSVCFTATLLLLSLLALSAIIRQILHIHFVVGEPADNKAMKKRNTSLKSQKSQM